MAALSASPVFADMIPYTGSGFTQYTVATSGIYQITAIGGSGGNSTISGTSGGLGISITGDFSLTAGELLDFYVGGAAANGGLGAGGGGGTFVVLDSGDIPLLIAGGGGGAGSPTGGVNATFDESGTYDADNTSAGGTNGGAGTGLLGGSGFVSGNNGCGFLALCGGGQQFAGSDGAYGGGAGGGNHAGGGGGGYSGGGGGTPSDGVSAGGGGGGSYVDVSAFSVTYTTAQAGNGSAEIDLVPASAPEPGTIVLVMFAFTGIWFFSARKQRS